MTDKPKSPTSRARKTPPGDAMLQNRGNERPPILDPEAADTPEGTTSDERLRGKPRRGSIERGGW